MSLRELRSLSLPVLTARERQVVVRAASGRTNKEIAYDLGLSGSTVRVLLSRAFARLGVHSRAELLALPCMQSLLGRAPPVTWPPGGFTTP